MPTAIPPSLLGPAIVVLLLAITLLVLWLTGNPVARGIVAAVVGLGSIALGLLAISRYKPRGPDVITKARADEAKATDAAAKTRDKAVQAADARRDAAMTEDTTNWINELERKEKSKPL